MTTDDGSPLAGDGLSDAYWEGAARGVLVLQRCGRCGRVRHYPRVLCDACYSFDVEHVEATGTGQLHSWTVAHHPYSPDVVGQTPYVLATVDMDEGVRVLGRLPAPTELRPGLALQISFEPGLDGSYVPVFAPVPD